MENWRKWLKEEFEFVNEDEFLDAMEKRRTFMSKPYWTMQWTVNEYRKDRRTGAISPVKGSKYFKELSKLGAGWSK